MAPLLKTQYGVYAECADHIGEALYNTPYFYTLDGSLDGERLRQAVIAATKNHPTFFTRITVDDDGFPVQNVDLNEVESWTLTLEVVDDIEEAKKGMIIPFDIYGGRLFNFRLLRDAEHFYLLLDAHHIINDYTSLKAVLTDIDAAYSGRPLEPEQLTLAELAVAEEKARHSEAFEEAKKWYADNFNCGDTYTVLLPDRYEPEHTEDNLTRTLDVDMAAVDAYCKANGVFKSNFFTTAYSIWLAKFNNERESLFTTIYNGRSDKRFLHSVGMTVKTLPVYARFDNSTTVLDLLRQMQDQMSGCRKHDIYSYIDLMQDLNPQSASMFAWHGMLFGDEQLCGAPMSTTRLCNSTLGVPLYLKAYILAGRYHIKAEYSSNEYSRELIAGVLESYEAVVKGMLECEKVIDINLTTPARIAELDTFNDNDVPYDNTQTIVSLFNAQADATPDAVAVVYKDRRYTYRQVNDLSDRIAANIAGRGLRRGDVVSILIPRCEWMAIASLGVLKAGCAYQPLDPTYPAERLNFMMKDAEAKLLIADAELRNIVDEYQGDTLLTSEFATLPQPIAPSFRRGLGEDAVPAPSDLFILLYTSGSTGVPKGCRLSHGNLVAFCNWYRRYYDLRPEHNVAAYASYGFDACMMDLYPALTTGATVHIVPEELRLDLIALNEYFEREGITHAFMTTQVGYQFATGIENHSLLHLSTGGEKLATLEPPTGYNFYNGYGPTECTIFTTTFPVKSKLKDIPIGKPLDNMHLYIVDQEGRRQPAGATGELWVSGPQVGMGYLNRPEKTVEVFISNPFDENPKYGRVYRTGDVVRYLPDGNIQFVGRRDGQVKIRGFRIELKEVESVIREFPGIKDATVQAFDEEGGGKFIAAYVVSDNTIDIDALDAFILERKPPYMVPAVTMQIDVIPLNQNQKVNKRALPKPEKKAAEVTENAPAAPLNVLEQELHDLIAGIAGNSEFGITTPLGYTGLTSISAIRLAVQVNKRYGVALDSKAILKEGTLQTVENAILKAMMVHPQASESSENSESSKDKGSAPLSYAQTGVYFECLKNPTSTIYNIPYLLSYPEGTDATALAEAARAAAACHPELRARFDTEGDAIVQIVDDEVAIAVPVTEMSDEQLADYKNEFVKPFNLRKAPLCRMEVVKTPAGAHLLLDVHHLAFDGGSADLLIRQINEVLEGKKPQAEQYTYLDFVADQQRAADGEEFAAARRFFAERLATCEGASEIPADLPKSDRQGLIGEAVVPVDHKSIGNFCRKQGITPAHLFLAATAYVTSRHTNNRDVYLCTVSGGRSNLKIADTVGMFVNTLALGLSIDDVTVADFLKAASDTFDTTLHHEDYPFATIAADYGFKPSIAYAYQVGVLQQYTVNGQKVSQELLELNVPKFKINIKIETRGVVVQYDDALYSERLAQSLAESIATVADNMADEPMARVRSLSIVSGNQERELQRLRQVATGEAPFRFMHECISHYAGTQPDQEALVAVDGTFTYVEMNRVTDAIAAGLQARGVKARDRVALLLPRTSRLILALFGTLKAGAAYIPCDPDYPADRVKLILEDSEARFIITTADRLDTLPSGKGIDVETLVATESASSLPEAPAITPDDLAYLIYTSGSTGRPKGVMLRHEGICNYLYGHPANVFANAVMTDATRVLSVTTISFDAALQDIGMALYNGKTLVVATEEQANNPLELAALIKRERIDMVSGTPSRWLTWLTCEDFQKAIAGIHIARAGGEKFSDQLLSQMRRVTKARIFNCYGPTEITVASNNAELTHAEVVTVGRPQLNVKEFIVDGDGNELPVGVVGELYIGGRGVGRGYNNLDEMTRERFIDYHGTRVYRSGDYARWLPDGNVIILGRTDHQIKLRGLRIELGEIENVMLKVDGMKKVVILIRQLGGKEHLCAYYTASREIAPDALKAEISKSLTQYMVPTAYLQLEAMPMTPNGKTDVKALPEPQLAVTGTYEEPATDTERKFAEIFAEILQMDRVGANDNFFELGGTSLVVTRVIIEADKAGLHVAYGDVFANPTPRALARLVGGGNEVEGHDEVRDYDYSAINRVLEANTLNAFRHGESRRLGNVLVTGATGYLGIHILRDLIDSDAEQIYCLVRGANVEKAESRLRTLLYYYFADSFKDLFGSRLHVITGDVTSPFGEGIKVDTVFNCAAIVKHFSEGTEIEDVNIGGAQRCVDYCLEHGATLVHISTASTRGLWAGEPRDDVFTEHRLYMGQYLGNKYIYSKFMAERLILDAVANRGLSAKIMRVGNLAARSTDGEFQANFSTNSFMGRIKVYNMLGCCPHAMRNKRVEFSPINEVAHAIVLLATTPAECTVFHPYNIHGQFLGDVLQGLTAVGDGVRFVEQEEFNEAMEAAGNDPAKAKSLSSLLAYQDMAHGQKTTDVARDNDLTIQMLYRLGFNWSPTSWDYVERMLTAIGGFGFFDL
ncbi:MAG: amino acid adenylation domain-containing protein [Muribaculaceae bacterium]|nr:amino acid adenylation domain-containing protein [Muribaculaceae bacterium]